MFTARTLNTLPGSRASAGAILRTWGRLRSFLTPLSRKYSRFITPPASGDPMGDVFGDFPHVSKPMRPFLHDLNHGDDGCKKIYRLTEGCLDVLTGDGR